MEYNHKQDLQLLPVVCHWCEEVITKDHCFYDERLHRHICLNCIDTYVDDAWGKLNYTERAEELKIEEVQL